MGAKFVNDGKIYIAPKIRKTSKNESVVNHCFFFLVSFVAFCVFVNFTCDVSPYIFENFYIRETCEPVQIMEIMALKSATCMFRFYIDALFFCNVKKSPISPFAAVKKPSLKIVVQYWAFIAPTVPSKPKGPWKESSLQTLSLSRVWGPFILSSPYA